MQTDHLVFKRLVLTGYKYSSLNFEVLLRIKNTSERLFKTKLMFLLYMERSYSIEMSKTTRSFGNIGIQIRFGVAL